MIQRWSVIAAGLSMGVAVALGGCADRREAVAPQPQPVTEQPRPPKYDHIVIVVEENKFPEQVLCGASTIVCPAPFLNRLVAEGTSFGQMYAEEHFSQGNYFWLFSGSNQGVGHLDGVPTIPPSAPFAANNMGKALLTNGLSFIGYAESLPLSTPTVDVSPQDCVGSACVYGRKHVPWLSFVDFAGPNVLKYTKAFTAFPQGQFDRLPTVSLVIPNLNNDMHNGKAAKSVPMGDNWLKQNLQNYYEWAKTHNSLLIVTFDEVDDETGFIGLTDPNHCDPVGPCPSNSITERVARNRIPTIFAGAHVKPGFVDPTRLTHVNLLRTIEAMYGLSKSGAQQPNALTAGIPDDRIITAAFVR